MFAESRATRPGIEEIRPLQIVVWGKRKRFQSEVLCYQWQKLDIIKHYQMLTGLLD